MKLYFDDKKDLFIFKCSYSERYIPGRAGFKWQDGRWASDSAFNAEKLQEYIENNDNFTKEKIEELKIGREEEIKEPEPRAKLLKKGDYYIIKCSYDDKDLVKNNGFKWQDSCWCSPYFRCVKSLYEEVKNDNFFDKETSDKIEELIIEFDKIIAEKEAKRQETIKSSFAKSADIEIPCGEGFQFLPYQKAGIKFALDRPNTLIADDMGVGKTAQAIGFLNASPDLKKVLIVCPASLTRNWKNEFSRFSSRSDLSIEISNTKKFNDADVIICNYDIFSRNNDTRLQIEGKKYDLIVLDEAQYIKNSKAKRTETILNIQSERKLFLTGTPIMNRPVELWTLAHALDKNEFNNFFNFAKDYCNAHQTRYGWDFSGASNLEHLQEKLRSSIMIRRMKSDVLDELPPKIRQIVELPADTTETKKALKAEKIAFEAWEKAKAKAEELKKLVDESKGADKKAYQEDLRKLRDTIQAQFTEISRLRKETAIAKAPMVVEAVRDASESGKIILFAHHRDLINLLKSELADLNPVAITGETPADQRQAIVDKFQNDPETKVFIGSIQASGVGLTLTESSHVIFSELDWTPSGMNQAEDRAYRLGQKNSVLVQHLVLEDSIDLWMAKKLVAKQQIIDEALNRGEEIDDTIEGINLPEEDDAEEEMSPIAPAP